MTHQCRMGYAPAIDYLPMETRKAHVTPPREVRGKVRTVFEAFDCMKLHAGPATPSQHDDETIAQTNKPEASPPSTTDKPQGVFKVGDRVRRTRGNDRETVETVSRIDTSLGFPRIWYRDSSGVEWWGDETYWVHADTTPSKQEDDGWVTHSGGKIPAHLKAGMVVDIRWSDGTEIANVRLRPEPGNGWSSTGLRIAAYRIVKDQA